MVVDGFFLATIVTDTVTEHVPVLTAFNVEPLAVQIFFEDVETVSERLAPFGTDSPT